MVNKQGKGMTRQLKIQRHWKIMTRYRTYFHTDRLILTSKIIQNTFFLFFLLAIKTFENIFDLSDMKILEKV